MPEEDDMAMSGDDRFACLRLMNTQYVETGRAERGCFVDQMGRMTDLHRKSLIRLMSSSRKRRLAVNRGDALIVPESMTS